jgi:hypothetical protein
VLRQVEDVARASSTRSPRDGERAAKAASPAVVVADCPGSLKRLVRAGVGGAFHTRIGFIDELRRGEIVAVPPGGAPPRRHPARPPLAAPAPPRPSRR